MTELITPTMKSELSSHYGVNYNSLRKTRLNFEGHRFSIIRTVGYIVFALTVIFPIIIFLGQLIFWGLDFLVFKNRKLTPFAIDRLKETEKKVQELAAKLGVANPNSIKVFLEKGILNSASAARSSIAVSFDFLISPKDLPTELSLHRLDNKELTEEEWIIKFIKWQGSILKAGILDRPISQLDFDRRILETQALLKDWRNGVERRGIHTSILAHELGHINHKHSLKCILANFGWDLLTIFSLGIAALFRDKALNSYRQRNEYEADAFSALKLRSGKGLIQDFKNGLEFSKIFHQKYPELIDKQGNDKESISHPPLKDRIRRLKGIEKGLI